MPEPPETYRSLCAETLRVRSKSWQCAATASGRTAKRLARHVLRNIGDSFEVAAAVGLVKGEDQPCDSSRPTTERGVERFHRGEMPTEFETELFWSMEGHSRRLSQGLPLSWRRDDRGLQLDEFGLGELAGAKHGDSWERTADHRDLVAGVEAWAGLAVLIDLIRQRGAVGDAEAEVKEEVWDAGEEADAGDALVLGFFEQAAKELAAGALALSLGLDDDGTNLGQVRAVDVEGAAAEKNAAAAVCSDGGFGHLEVADVLAYFGVVAAEQGAVAGEGVDELEQVDGVLELGLADVGTADARPGRGGRGGVTDLSGWNGGGEESGQVDISLNSLRVLEGAQREIFAPYLSREARERSAKNAG